MSSGKRALRNTVLGATSLGFQAIVSLIVSVVIARALGPERTGVYAFCMWLASILTLPAKLGMELPLSKYISEYLGRGASEKAAAVARYFLNVQSVVALALGVIYVSVVETLVAAPARNRLLIVLVIVLIAANRDVLAAILTGAQEYGVLLITSVIVGVVHVGGVLAVALMHGDVGPMLAAVAFGVAAGSVFSGIRADRIMGGGPREALPNESRTRIWRFIRSAFWLGIFYTIVWQRTEISILRTFSPAADIAYFFIGFAMVEKLEAAMSTFTAALLPISSERYGESGLEHQARMYERAIRYAEMLVIPLSLLALTTVGPAVRLLYGENFLDVIPIAQVGFAGMMITTLIGVPASFLVALEHERLLTWMWGVAAVLNVALALVIVPRFGGMGAALTKVTVQIVTTAASLIALQRILHASFPWRSTLRFLLIGAVSFAPAGIASYYNSWMWLIPLAAGGLGLNLAALRWTGDFGTTEIDLVRHAFQLRTAAATRSS